MCRLAWVSKGHSRSFIRLWRVVLLRSFIVLRTVLFGFAKLSGEKNITEAECFNITIDISKISLQILICNITYTYTGMQKRTPDGRPFLYFKNKFEFNP